MSLSIPNLPAELEQLLQQVPRGSVTTYGDLAKALGNVIAARWVGSFLLHHERSTDWPTHRVVRSDGTLGLYAHGDVEAKAVRLREEGANVMGDGDRLRVNLEAHRHAEFDSTRPLEALRRLQLELPGQCDLTAPSQPPNTVAGLDVSYGPGNLGIGGYALVEYEKGDVLWSTTVQYEVNFPYISSYLSFRELPVLQELLDTARAAGKLADVCMIDGAGIMHPRRCGIATHFGIACGVATIGVTKKLLAGAFDNNDVPARQPRDVTDGEDLLGVAIRPREISKRFIWSSPGHRMDVATAAEVTINMLRNHRLPEPIYWADRLSRQAVAKK